MLKYLSGIKDPSQLSAENLPSLVRELENTNSSTTQKYISTASIVGGGVASAVSVSVSSSLLSSSMVGGLGAAAFGGAGALGMGAFPALGWFAIPIIAAPLAIKVINDIKIKKYISNNKSSMEKNQSDMEKQKKRLLKWLESLQENAAELDRKMAENRKKQFSDFKKKAKKLAEEVKIKIDDFVNVDTNKRIMQYNEVILDQYRLQKELEEKVEYLFVEYNELLDQKKELERQVACLIKLLNAMGCPESVINQALS